MQPAPWWWHLLGPLWAWCVRHFWLNECRHSLGLDPLPHNLFAAFPGEDIISVALRLGWSQRYDPNVFEPPFTSVSLFRQITWTLPFQGGASEGQRRVFYAPKYVQHFWMCWHRGWCPWLTVPPDKGLKSPMLTGHP